MSIGSAFLAHLKSEYSNAFSNWATGYNQGEGNLREGKPDQAYQTAFLSHIQDLESFLEPNQSSTDEEVGTQ
jgi:hypothetical protein